MSKRNESIGTVECPVKACEEQSPVFRFRERGETEKSIANRRFAGRLYGKCPSHGRFGGDPGEQAMQEYILDQAVMYSPSAGDRRPAPAKAPAAAPAKVAATPARSPANTPARPPAKQVSNGISGWVWPWE